MFWDIFLSSSALIGTIIFVGWLCNKLLSGRGS